MEIQLAQQAEQTKQIAGAVKKNGDDTPLQQLKQQYRAKSTLAQRNKLQQLLAHIDCLINRQLNSILHHPRFQRMEASWRGVAMMADTLGYDKRVQIKLLTLSAAELHSDVILACEFDQSAIFNKVFSAEFDQPGGEPYGILIGDYYFSHRMNEDGIDSISFLSQMSKIAATAFVPFIAGVSPQLFAIEDFCQLRKTAEIDNFFNSAEYQRWKLLRRDKDSCYIGLAMPRILMRQPYNSRGYKSTQRFFQERVLHSKDYLWGNAAYAYACSVINSFIETSWFANSCGVDQQGLTGGLVELPRDGFVTDSRHVAVKCATEFVVTDRLEKQLSDCGIIAVKDNQRLRRAIFYNDCSIYAGSQRRLAQRQVDQRIASMLHYLLCACRFAHYIKVIMRDKIGSFINPNECQTFLTTWLQRYCVKNYSSSLMVQARYPLSHAKVEVTEQVGRPGYYVCALDIQPYYQLDSVQSILRLVTEIKLNR